MPVVIIVRHNQSPKSFKFLIILYHAIKILLLLSLSPEQLVNTYTLPAVFTVDFRIVMRFTSNLFYLPTYGKFFFKLSLHFYMCVFCYTFILVIGLKIFSESI